MRQQDVESSLEILEQQYWGEAPEGSSYLVTSCHSLRKKRLKDLNTEDLRLLIGQQIGLTYLVPLAINVLQDNPLAEGNFFEGDLLCHVLRYIPCDYWKRHKGDTDQLGNIIDKTRQHFLSIREEMPKEILASIDTFCDCFKDGR